MGWNEMERGRRFMEDDFEQDEIERAYRKGCEKGYRKAMEEIEEDMDGYGERGGYSGGGYGEREGGYGERDGGYGERRGVKGTGRYSRYRRR